MARWSHLASLHEFPLMKVSVDCSGDVEAGCPPCASIYQLRTNLIEQKTTLAVIYVRMLTNV